MKAQTTNRLVAVVGGSGAGKTWLADQLQKSAGNGVGRLSLDNFYRDRSRLSPARREGINYDHPRAIDWPLVEKALKACRAGRCFRVPRYDFVTHTRQPRREMFRPKPLNIVEGLWLLLRPSVRALFALRIFIDCPVRVRLARRQARDSAERGRSRESVRNQFWETVSPMHDRYVAPQARWAHVVLESPPTPDRLHQLTDLLRTLRNSEGDI
ncbi:MAG: uridine kinase [Verrucomicrobia bacterium]|nr:MAG: uridine kinase [Verrucomicrobiota bacterium]